VQGLRALPGYSGRHSNDRGTLTIQLRLLVDPARSIQR